MIKKDKNKLIRARHIIGAVLVFVTLPLFLPASKSHQSPNIVVPRGDKIPVIAPQLPKTDVTREDKIFIEKADSSVADNNNTIYAYGNVVIKHGGMTMYCDSAVHYAKDDKINAYGHIKMEQGDTLFIYADELNYVGGDLDLAYLYGTESQWVRMINRNVTLETPVFCYDLAQEFGYYENEGILTDDQNQLTSIIGEYVPSTKDASFFQDVRLISKREGDTITIDTDTLYYNADSHISRLVSPSEIVSKDGTIYTSNGTYNTDTQIANLFDRSQVVASTGTILTGDTLFYDRNIGIGEVFGNMEITDSANSVILTGDYGYYNEVVDSAFATGRALAKEFSQGDTLYLHGKYLFSYSVTDSTLIPEDTIAGTKAYTQIDTTHVMVAHPRVRFYRSDMQGLCDSMRFEQKDSTMYMYHHPIVWSGDRQIFGNEINVHVNDSTIDKAVLPDFGFSAEWKIDKFYDQLSGKEMIAYFEGGKLNQIDVNGNVQAIMLPEDNEKDEFDNPIVSYSKIVNVESSFLTANFHHEVVEKDGKKQETMVIDRMKMWPETSGTVTPLYLAKKSLYYLPQFKWYESLRPTSPEDVFNISDEMELLMADIPASTVIPPRRININGEIEDVIPEGDTDQTDSAEDDDSAPTDVAEDDDSAITENTEEDGTSEGTTITEDLNKSTENEEDDVTKETTTTVADDQENVKGTSSESPDDNDDTENTGSEDRQDERG